MGRKAIFVYLVLFLYIVPSFFQIWCSTYSYSMICCQFFIPLWTLSYTETKKYPNDLSISSVKRLFWNQNLKMIPSEYRDILYVILKILNRSLKWRTVHLWTPTGSASTSRQSWTLKKTARFSSKTVVFFERSTLTAGMFESSRSSETCCTSF